MEYAKELPGVLLGHSLLELLLQYKHPRLNASAWPSGMLRGCRTEPQSHMLCVDLSEAETVPQDL